MTKKQIKTRNRIILVLILFFLLLIADRTGFLERLALPAAVIFILYLIPYLLIGYDIILKAARNIRNGQVFD